MTYNYISQLAVPEYILGLVRAKPLYLVLFLLILGAAFLFALFWVLVLPLFTLERKSLWEAVQESAAHVKTQLPRLAGVLLRWNLSALIRSVLVFFGASLLVYSVAALIGLRSTRAMLLLARALYLLEIPFFGFLLDCKVTTAQCTIIAFLYDRTALAAGPCSPLRWPGSRWPPDCWQSISMPCPRTMPCSPPWAA